MSTTKRLFHVTLGAEIVVLAESAVEAERVALGVVRDMGRQDFDVWAQDLTSLPSGWALTSLPYSAPGAGEVERTIQGWVDCGAGEAYRGGFEGGGSNPPTSSGGG